MAAPPMARHAVRLITTLSPPSSSNKNSSWPASLHTLFLYFRAPSIPRYNVSSLKPHSLLAVGNGSSISSNGGNKIMETNASIDGGRVISFASQRRSFDSVASGGHARHQKRGPPTGLLAFRSLPSRFVVRAESSQSPVYRSRSHCMAAAT